MEDILIEFEPYWMYKAKQLKKITDSHKLGMIRYIDKLNINHPHLIKMKRKYEYMAINPSEFVEDLVKVRDIKRIKDEFIKDPEVHTKWLKHREKIIEILNGSGYK